MRSFLYEGDRALDLCRARSMSDLIGELLPAYPVTSALDFERSLVVMHVKELLRVGVQLSGAFADFYEWALARYCLENVKVILRSGFSGESAETTRALVADLPAPLALPLDRLVEVRTSPASIPALIPHRPIADLVARAMIAGDNDPFLLESAMDAGYLRMLVKAAEDLPRRHRAGAVRLVGCEVDTANVMLALRARLNYELEPEAVAPFFDEGGAVPPERWHALVADPSVERAMELTRVEVPRKPRATRLEWELTRKLYRLACGIFRRSLDDFGVVVAFFYIKRAELADLLQVVGAQSYGLSADDLRPRLVTEGAA